MTKTFVSIQRQIDKLQKEAALLKEKEIGGVIERIRSAIAFYNLTPADLFDAKAKGRRKNAAGAAAKPGTKKRAAKTENAERIIKYKDEAGNSWTGRGKRPGWFKAALEAGKTAEDLLVKA